MTQQLLRIGHSPDPDDAFMFYALAKDRIPTGPYRFEHQLQDIQTLNQRAMRGELEISAISIHAYPYVAKHYALMSCGSSMGDDYGPMIVTTTPMTIDDLKGKHIAIPGKLTTAFLTLQLLLGQGTEARRHEGTKGGGSGFGVQGSGDIRNPKSEIRNHFTYEVVPFDAIPRFVLEGKADAGLIIHEGQLTYKSMGLHLVVDLGVWFARQTGLPLPLGGNVVRRDLGPKVMQEATNIVRQSIQYSLDHRDKAVEYALQFGRDLDKALADRFVGMYVNHWTLDYGKRGMAAIDTLLQKGSEAGLVPPTDRIDYVTAEG